MSTSQGRPGGQNESSYVMDAESAAEMARLMRQDQLLTRGMGGTFPEKLDLTNVQRILDLACGPGGWALETAFTYSDIDVRGVDISERMITYANAQTEVQQRSNASFQVMNILKPLDFPAACFDLVNARFISGFMRPDMWPGLFAECLRILRPDGILRLTEFEWGMSNKPTYEKICGMIHRALSLAGYSFSPNGLYHGIIPVLPRLFQNAGLQNLNKMVHVVDFSAGTEAHEGFYHDMTSGFQLIEPFIVQTQLATLEEWRDLYHKGLAEMFDEDFCAMWILMTVWGNKPI